MKKLLCIAAMLLGVTAAPAAVSFGFDGDLPAGVTRTGGYIADASVHATHLKPTANGGNFLVSQADNIATILFGTGYHQVSFTWGSPDSWNTLVTLGKGGEVLSEIIGQGDGRNVPTRWSYDGPDAIYGLTFKTTRQAFEADEFTLSAQVPEPANWAMMLMGFGLIGATARSNRRVPFARCA
jgi:hypothetical protein